MQVHKISAWLFACLPLVLAGCGDKKEGAPAKGPKDAPEAAHAPAPHGGELLELGEEEAHLELIHDSKTGTVTVYVLGKDAKTPVVVAAPTIVLAMKDGPQELTLTAVNPKADGTADTFKGTHDGLKAEPLDGRIRVTIGGKTHQSPLEAAPHDH